MRGKFDYLIRCMVLVLGICLGQLRAQVNAPDLRCLAVNASGDVTLTWLIPPDPLNQFFSYEVYHSPIQTGPYTLVATITTYAQTTTLHTGAAGNVQGQYYYMVTHWGAGGANTSAPSDTLRTLYLNLANPGNGQAVLTWSPMHTPPLPSATGVYRVYREYPAGVWNLLRSTTGLNLRDTISICRVNYGYRLESDDASGCTSVSNAPSDQFFDLTPPVLPPLDSVSVNAAGQAELGWDPSPSPDAIGYVIYINQGGNWIPVDTVYGNATGYVYTGSNANSVSETYCVAALDSCKNISPLSTGANTIHLKAAYDLCQRSASLSWNSYTNLNGGILNYRVWCSVNGGPYVLLGTTSNLTYQQQGLTPGATYCYYVQVVNTPQTITASSNRTCLNAIAALVPSYVYIRSASVNVAGQVDLRYYIDNSVPLKGCSIYRSRDGINFSFLAYQPYPGGQNLSYTDNSYLTTSTTSYYYRIDVSDSCGNPGISSNVARTMVLTVMNDNDNVYYNHLQWNNYEGWPSASGVASYNIYRSVDGVFSPVPIANVPFGTSDYVDDVENFSDNEGEFGYYVEALEGFGNPYGFADSSHSNRASAYVEVSVFVPNAFVPDGRNKQWRPEAQFVAKTDYRVIVFDRWGQKQFETNNDTDAWTGDGAKDDVYIYYIQYKNARGEFIELHGFVTLVR